VWERISSAVAAGHLINLFGPEVGGGAGETLALTGEEAVGFLEQGEQSRVVSLSQLKCLCERVAVS
jgi:hypothetical protein